MILLWAELDLRCRRIGEHDAVGVQGRGHTTCSACTTSRDCNIKQTWPCECLLHTCTVICVVRMVLCSALAIASDVAKSAPLSLRMAKAAISHGMDVDLSTGLKMVSCLHMHVMYSVGCCNSSMLLPVDQLLARDARHVI